MTEKSNAEDSEREFEKIIAGYSDNELRTVLKKRSHYRKEAADFAIQEAIRRGLIYSEQDLFASEYKLEKEKFSVFPNIDNEKIRNKYKKSISRSLMLLGVVPLILGGIKIFKTQSIEGILIFVFGAVWSFSSFKLMQAINIKLINLLILLYVVAVAYLVKTIIEVHFLSTIDILVMLMAVLSVLYGIGFLRSLRD